MAMTAFAIHRLGIFSPLVSGDWKSLSAEQWAKFYLSTFSLVSAINHLPVSISIDSSYQYQ
jgi:hypothetical protein